VNIRGRLIEYLPRSEPLQCPTRDLHLEFALENINNSVCIMPMKPVEGAGSIVNSDNLDLLPRQIG